MKNPREVQIMKDREIMAQIISDQWYVSLEKRYPKLFKDWKQPIRSR